MYQYLLSLFLFAGLFINIHQAAKLPNYITPCAKNDPNLNECALENGRKAIPNILSGDSTYGIPSLLPLKLDKLVLDEGQLLSLNLENIEVHGLDKADLKDVKIDLNQNEVAITLAIPDVKIKSDYNVNGQLLSLPIQGHGPATFEFTNYILPCAKNDPNLNECALENGRKAIPGILPGDSTYGIPSMLPLKLDKLVLEDGQKLSLNLENIEVRGLDKADLKGVKIDLNQDEVTIILAIPEVKIKSGYNINGKLLNLPLQGHGPAMFEFTDTEFTYKLQFNKINKAEAEYLQISNSSLQTDIKSAHIQLDNLFNGDKQLGDQMNKLLNEHWEDIRHDIQPTVSKAIRSVIDKTFGNILDIVPLNEVFLNNNSL